MYEAKLSAGASIAVIGAGIIGVASACALMRQGYEVTVYDPEPPGEAGPSRANAGHIGASDIYPLSTPGIHWKALKMLMDSDGALKIPANEALAQIPWFWRFWRTSHGKRFDEATNALSYLCRSALNDTSEIFEFFGLSDMLKHNGCAFLYDTEQSFTASKNLWANKRTLGFANTEMDARQITHDIPSISDKFRHAVLSHQWANVSEPLEAVQGLARAAEAQGVIFQRRRVNSISERLDAVTLETDQGKSQYDAVIVAAGVDSVAFAKSCGDFLPMAAERGYNLTIPTPSVELDLSLVFADRGIVATSLASGLRIGGWAEYASPSRPANQNYFRSMARISGGLFPGLDLNNAEFWMGSRPSMPDSVPVISRSRKVRRVFYNCGHGHYGLTHAATSARLLCEVVGGSETLSGQWAFSIDRFV